MVPLSTTPSFLVEVTAYHSSHTERSWVLPPEATQPMPPRPPTLDLMFEYAHDHSTLRVNASFASATAVFENVRAAKAGAATPTLNPTIAASAASVTAGESAVGLASAARAGVALILQDQHTRAVVHPFANLIPLQGVP